MDSNDYKNFGMASGAGGLLAGAGQLFFGNSGRNPYDVASRYFDQIPGAAHYAYDPYINAGNQARDRMQGQFNTLVNDPSAVYRRIAGQYQQSPGYNWMLNQGRNEINNAAAAGGMIGTPEHQYQAGQMAEGLANQDFHNYLQDALGLYNTGLQGYGGIAQMGYGSSDALARALMESLSNQGALSYASQADENKARSEGWGDIFGGLGTIAAFL